MPDVAPVKTTRGSADVLEFSPGMLGVERSPPSPLPRVVLYLMAGLLAALLVWATLGRLDIVAVADGKLVPQSFVKIVQPTDSGVVREILVGEGDHVRAGQTLVRMDSSLSDADRDSLGGLLAIKRLQLRRIDAELAGKPLEPQTGDAPETFAQVSAQYQARRMAHLDALGAESALLAKAKADYAASLETQIKLKQSAPIYKEQAQAWDKLAREGFAGKLLALERRRVHLESEQDLRAQNAAVRSLGAQVQQAERRLDQIVSKYGEDLQNERVATQSEVDKLVQDSGKQAWRQDNLELKAPQDGIIKDLATHTVGSVVQPGTVLMTLVPTDEPMQAEVWVRHIDAGFVKPDQAARIKVAAFPFQKYGLVEGKVRNVSPDATEASDQPAGRDRSSGEGYRTLVAVAASFVERNGERLKLSPGMAVSAEIVLGRRTVLEYLLSPIQKTMHEAGRER